MHCMNEKTQGLYTWTDSGLDKWVSLWKRKRVLLVNHQNICPHIRRIKENKYKNCISMVVVTVRHLWAISQISLLFRYNLLSCNFFSMITRTLDSWNTLEWSCWILLLTKILNQFKLFNLFIYKKRKVYDEQETSEGRNDFGDTAENTSDSVRYFCGMWVHCFSDLEICRRFMSNVVLPATHRDQCHFCCTADKLMVKKKALVAYCLSVWIFTQVNNVNVRGLYFN